MTVAVIIAENGEEICRMSRPSNVTKIHWQLMPAVGCWPADPSEMVPEPRLVEARFKELLPDGTEVWICPQVWEEQIREWARRGG